jgi:pimeloyl-ACP methyl ester carboxylesterase
MAIDLELARTVTADGNALHGVLFRPRDANGADTALLQVHGVASNFYSGPLPKVGQALAERGYHLFCMNTRGHDWVNRAGPGGSGFGGAAHENFEDSPLDVDAGLDFLSQRGYRRFVVFGHSLGAVKAVYYQGLRQRADVLGVIACSAPRQFYRARAIEQEDFPERMREAERMVAEGRGEDYLWALASGSIGLFTARTYVSKYGRHERNDVRPHAASLTIPLLAIVGGLEDNFFHQHAQELAEAAGPERGAWHVVEGANHAYDDRIPVLTDLVAGWLSRVLA